MEKVKKISSKFYQRIFFTALFVAIIVIGYYITRPFLVAFFTGAIVAYLSYPLYEKILKKVKSRNLASLIVTFLVILLISVPITLLIGLVSKEAYSTYSELSGKQNLGANFMEVICEDGGLVCSSAKKIIGFLPEGNLDYYIKLVVERITKFIINNGYGFLSAIPSIALNFFVMLFVIFYLLKDGPALGKRLTNILPLKEHHKKEVVQRFHNVTSEVFYANMFIALLQGALGTFGFIILGVPSPLLWGSVMTIFAFVPYFGTAIIWVPAALNLIFTGQVTENNPVFIRGVLLLLYGILIISSIDNIIKPRLIGKKANIHPILVLLGVLGGLRLFGFIGLILGPLMLAILVTFLDIYEKEKEELEKSTG